MVHNIELEFEQKQETNMDKVNINSIRFNSNCSALIANLKHHQNKVINGVPYKVEMETVEQLAATKR